MIRTSRTVDVDLPGFARKVLKPTNTMIQTDTWSARDVDGARDGDFEIEVKGAPVNVSGQMRIEPTASGGTRHTVDGKLDVKVPLIGGKVGRNPGLASGDFMSGLGSGRTAQTAGVDVSPGRSFPHLLASP